MLMLMPITITIKMKLHVACFRFSFSVRVVCRVTCNCDDVTFFLLLALRLTTGAVYPFNIMIHTYIHTS